MEKEEEPKFASSTNLASGVLSENEKSMPDATDDAKNAITGCQNQQYTALLQRTLNPQHAGEKSSTPPPTVNEQLQLPQNLANLQHHLGQQQFFLSSQPLWLQPRPSYQLAGTDGLASFQPCISGGGTESSWQAPAMFGTGASSTCQLQAPNFGYPVGYPTYPGTGFSGPWEPSIWWGQTQPLLFPGMSNHPRAYGFVSSQSLQMPISSCVTSSGQPLLRGVIKPPEKLSKKHQRLWEAQTAENVQLWNMIGQLQGELADCKGRLIKLEAEISSLRPAAMEEHAVEARNRGITVTRQPAKRGRPKRAVGSQPPLQRRARGRKPALGRTKVEEAKPTDLGKGSLNNANDEDKNFSFLDTTGQDRIEDISATIIPNNGNMQIDEGTLKINQVLQQFPGIESCGIEFKSPSLSKSNYEGKHSLKNSLLNPVSAYRGFLNISNDRGANSGKGNFIWPSGIISEDFERRNTFYTNGNVSRQGITRWSFEDEEDAAESGFPAAGHKKENEEMGDEFSSGPEEIETQNGSCWCGK